MKDFRIRFAEPASRYTWIQDHLKSGVAFILKSCCINILTSYYLRGMQVLYNVTVSLDPNAEQEWLSFMRSVHIPEVMATGCFLESRLSRLNNEEDDGITYAITYVCPGKEDLDRYSTEFAPALQLDHAEKFNGRFAAFRTTLDVIEHFTNEGQG